MNKKISAAVLALALLPGLGRAQTVQPPTERSNPDNTRFGGTSAVFLTLPADARGAALGRSFGAIVDDAGAMFYNPAGLSLMNSNMAMFSYTPYIASTRHISAGLGWSLRGGEWGLGLSLVNFGFSDSPVYTEDAEEGNGEKYSVSNTAIGVTGAFQFSDRFSAGLTTRLVTEQLGRTSSTGITVDFGTNYHAELGGRAIRASFAILNYGTPLRQSGPVLNTAVNPIDNSMNVEDQPATLRASAFDPPTEFRVSVAYDVMSSARNRVTAMGEFAQPNDNKPGAGAGLELMSKVSGDLSAALRGSYTYQGDNQSDVSADFATNAFNSDVSSKDGLDGLAAGAGLAWRAGRRGSISLDYAFRHLGNLGTTNMFAVKVGF